MMQPWAKLIAGAALLGLVFSSTPSRPGDGTLSALNHRVSTCLRAGRIDEAEALLLNGSLRADQDGDFRQSAHLRGNLASVQFMMFRYQQALKTYQEAAAIARAHGLEAEEDAIKLSLASLYLQFGDCEAASRLVAEAGRTVMRFDPYHLKHQLLAELAYLDFRKGNLKGASTYLLSAIAEAGQIRRLPNTPDSELLLKEAASAVARDWSILGEELLLAGELQASEFALDQAFRIRATFHDPDIRLSYQHLAWLRLNQVRLEEAAALLREAAKLRDNGLALHPWLPLYIEGRIRQSKGDRKGALASFSVALTEARHYLDQIALSGAPTEYAQKRLKQLYADVIDASLAVDPLGLDGFLATEDDRNLSLRQSTAAKEAFLRKAPPEYWSHLAKLHAAEAQMLSQNTIETRSRVSQLKTELEALEIKAGLSPVGTTSSISLENSPSPRTLRSIQQELAGDEALLSFHVATNSSALWVLTRDRIEFHRLPSEAELDRLIARFRSGVEMLSPDRDQAGHELYRALFGVVGAAKTKKFWTIAAEGSFFQIPLSTLPVESKKGITRYLVQDHALLYSPAALTEPRHQVPLSGGRFVGVGDGIYNLADQRRQKDVRFSLALFGKTPTLEMARLAASDAELLGSARAWDGAAAPVLLTGRSASTKALQDQLAGHPAVVHIASHFVSPHPSEVLIHLGLTPEGAPDVLGEKEIAAFRVPGAIVVMNGCSSGDGRAIAMAGVLGLTRAWILAGARAVVASKWPVSDDDGQLFLPFYRNLRSETGSRAGTRAAAESLQHAQVEMLQSGTWRSDPSYWGAFYVTGKD